MSLHWTAPKQKRPRKPTREEAIGLIFGSPFFIIIWLLSFPLKALRAACEYLDDERLL